jgi:hypothetical protein
MPSGILAAGARTAIASPAATLGAARAPTGSATPIPGLGAALPLDTMEISEEPDAPGGRVSETVFLPLAFETSCRTT